MARVSAACEVGRARSVRSSGALLLWPARRPGLRAVGDLRRARACAGDVVAQLGVDQCGDGQDVVVPRGEGPGVSRGLVMSNAIAEFVESADGVVHVGRCGARREMPCGDRESTTGWWWPARWIVPPEAEHQLGHDPCPAAARLPTAAAHRPARSRTLRRSRGRSDRGGSGWRRIASRSSRSSSRAGSIGRRRRPSAAGRAGCRR